MIIIYFQKVTCHVDFVSPVNIETEAFQRMVPNGRSGQNQMHDDMSESDCDEPTISLPEESQSKDEVVSSNQILKYYLRSKIFSFSRWTLN